MFCSAQYGFFRLHVRVTLQVWPGVSAALRVATPSSEVPRTEGGSWAWGGFQRGVVLFRGVFVLRVWVEVRLVSKESKV